MTKFLSPMKPHYFPTTLPQIPWGVLLSIVVLLKGQIAGADLIQTFHNEYPAAAKKLEEVYSHVKIKATETRTDHGKFLWTEEIDCWREGVAVRVTRNVLKSSDSRWAVGTFGAFGSDGIVYFDVYKQNDGSDFQFNKFGSSPEFSTTASLKCPALYAPYSFINQRLVDYLNRDDVHVVNVSKTTFEGEEVIKVQTESAAKPQGAPDWGVARSVFYLIPSTWALTGWTASVADKAPQSLAGSWNGRIKYQLDTNPPKIQSYDSWMENIVSTRYSGRQGDVTRVDFGAIPLKEFTVAAVGVKNIPATSNGESIIEQMKTAAANDKPESGGAGSIAQIAPAETSGGSVFTTSKYFTYTCAAFLFVVAGVLFQLFARRNQKKTES